MKKKEKYFWVSFLIVEGQCFIITIMDWNSWYVLKWCRLVKQLAALYSQLFRFFFFHSPSLRYQLIHLLLVSLVPLCCFCGTYKLCHVWHKSNDFPAVTTDQAECSHLTVQDLGNCVGRACSFPGLMYRCHALANRVSLTSLSHLLEVLLMTEKVSK